MELTVYEEIVRIAIVSPKSRLDAFAAPELRERLETLLAGTNRLVIDLSAVPFIDSAGMAVLVSAMKRARQAGGDVRLVWPTDDAARRILYLTKFDRVFVMADTVEAATKEF
ncbi:MAG: STAS domain-containing protein [Chloroflexaceae bacterium]|nr:STAS domain-containing protein [Chloroflexaceae bacterium]